jgi:hypothetical protein
MKRTKKTKYTLYISRNMRHNHCCHGIPISVTCSECVSVALVIQNGKHMCHVVICGLPGSTIVFHIISYTAWFLGKKCY